MADDKAEKKKPKRKPCEREIGGVHSSEDAGDNITSAERRDATLGKFN
jgi:hypothetical protein